jgi:hypothetical protein
MGLGDALKEATHVSGPPEQPKTGPFMPPLATKPEWYIHWALGRLGKKLGEDYQFRGEVDFLPSLAAQAQLDFTMLDGSQIAIEVQGIHWHYELGTTKIALDQFRTAQLQAAGWQVMEIDEDDALRDPIYYTREALQGRSHAYRYKPYFIRPT